jgi:MFS transporter, CP family, cyanate transporter
MLGLALILPVLRARTAQSVASLTAMALCVGYLVAASGPWILGLVHDASGSWSAALVALLAITLVQLVPGAYACRARVLG